MAAPVPSELPSYRGYRYPAEIIGHAVWLYFRFSLSLRDVEELLAERADCHVRDDSRLVLENSARPTPLDCVDGVHA